MSDEFSKILSAVNESAESARQLRQTMDSVMEALNKRGVQIKVDFDTTTQNLYRSIDITKREVTIASRQGELLQELVRITALLTSSLELDTVLEAVLDTIIRLTGAERAYLMLQHPGANQLQVQVARNATQESLDATDITFSQGIIDAAIQDRAPVITTNAQSDERFEARKSVMSNSLRSIIVIPLFLGDEIVGVLYADNRIEQGLFRQESIPILAAFANQAAIAISNARLFEQVKDDLADARRKVEALQIQIDEQRVQREVSNITENDFFEQLTQRVAEIRSRRDQNE